jgi:ATP-dependent DNA ligase
MEAKHVDDLPAGSGWQYEPKWDGFRGIFFRDHGEVFISSRKELPFVRYFPELVEAITTLDTPRLVVDGEIVVFTPDRTALDFDVLSQRIHPAASRVLRLSKETPASYIVFDLLALGDDDLRRQPLRDRRAGLEAVMEKAEPPLFLSPRTSDRDEATGWLEDYVIAGLDGVVAKGLDSVYRPGEREMRKVKKERTADCVLVGWRWAKDQRGVAVGSLLLGLYQENGELAQVGFTSGFSQADRRRLVPELEQHRSGPTVEVPNTPEFRSRWNADKDLSFEPLKPDLVVEVGFDQVTAGRIRHGARFKRWRPDKPASQCTWEQLVRTSNVDLETFLR